MKLASLYSGGKDSAYALWAAMKEDHKIDKMVSIVPKRRDSWMFHKPNPRIMELSAEAADIPLIRKETEGIKEKELEDLKKTLSGLQIEGVISGALASEYQRKRLEKICEELNLRLLSPIWNLEPVSHLKNLNEEGFEVIITSVSAAGLNSNWLGRRLDTNTINELQKLHKKFGIHIAGEGGEYETTALDTPFFKQKIVPQKIERTWEKDRGHLKIKEAKLAEKY